MQISIQLFLFVFTVVTGKYTGPTNQAGLNIIKESEGFHPDFYNDSSGHYYIGYGHFCRDTSSCTSPISGKYEVPLSPASAEALLKEDLKNRDGPEACVNNAISFQQLGPNEFSALVSFVHSVGCDAFWGSYLRNKVNRGHTKEAESEFARNVYTARGWRHKALMRRRKTERILFSKDAPLRQLRSTRRPRKTYIKQSGEPCSAGYRPIRYDWILNVEFCIEKSPFFDFES